MSEDIQGDRFAREMAKLRADGIAAMVRDEPGTIWADGHALMTCGGHTGHFVKPIAFCESPDWARAIASAIEASNAATLARSQTPNTDTDGEAPTPSTEDA